MQEKPAMSEAKQRLRERVKALSPKARAVARRLVKSKLNRALIGKEQR